MNAGPLPKTAVATLMSSSLLANITEPKEFIKLLKLLLSNFLFLEYT